MERLFLLTGFLVHDGVPVVDILGLAKLDSAEGVVELGAVGAGLFAEDIALAGLGVIEALDGADDSRSEEHTF